MNGDSCDMIAPGAKLGFFKQLLALGVKCTRLDIRLDVSRALVSMDDVHAAAEAGNVVGFKRYDPRRSRDMYSGELDEDQALFGSRGKNGGGTYYRVYDKGLESDGEIDCIRFEAELSGDRADAWFATICGATDTAAMLKWFGTIAVSSIGFFDKSGAHQHRDRFAILGWWEKLVHLVGESVKLATSRVKPSLEGTVRWACATWPRALARIANAVDCQGMNGAAELLRFVEDLVDAGERKLQSRPAPLLDQGLSVGVLRAERFSPMLR
jgi:hypothetical protein